MVTPANPSADGIDVEAVERAIHAAEQRTSGEIRVAIVRSWFWGDVRDAAESAFGRLGVAGTRARNGVLIFVALPRRKLVVLGDVGVQAKVAPALWAAVIERMSADFRRGEPTAGLIAGIEFVASALAGPFPPRPGDVNELTNSVSIDRG
jgi:uncharacterized membrane protein